MAGLQNIANFTAAVRCSQISEPALEALKVRLLDTLGVAIGACDAAPAMATPQLDGTDGTGSAATVLGGGRAAPARAAYHNTALARRLDFMDAYLGRDGFCHPSDSIGALLAAADVANARGSALLAAMAVAYEVQIRLADAVRTDANYSGLGPATATAVAVAAAKLLGQDVVGMTRAVSIAVANGWRATSGPSGVPAPAVESGAAAQTARPPDLPTAPQIAAAGVRAALQAAAGTADSVGTTCADNAHVPDAASVDWSDNRTNGVLRSIVLRHNADPFAQSAIDASISLATPPVCNTRAIRRVEVKTFQRAYDVLGGGPAPDARHVDSRRAALHSLPYLVAIALLDHQVQPAQYADARIRANDVQTLLRNVTVSAYAPFTRRFPAEMPAQIAVELVDGTWYCTSAVALQEFTLRPLQWEVVRDKFNRLTAPFMDRRLAERVALCIRDLEHHDARELTGLLARIPLSQHDSAPGSAPAASRRVA